jgi:hypothetical protein
VTDRMGVVEEMAGLGFSSSSVVPPTAVRRNITQRRSRDKIKDEGDTVPRSSLLSRKPRSRSKDRRYSVESTGEMVDFERTDWRSSASARFSPPPTRGGTYQLNPYPAGDPDHGLRGVPERSASSMILRKSRGDKGTREGTGGTRTHEANRVLSSTHKQRTFSRLSATPISSKVDTTEPFRRDCIPSEQEYPELHRSLTQMWYERQEAVRGMGDALGEDDSERYSTLKIMVDFLNDAMHTEWASLQRV